MSGETIFITTGKPMAEAILAASAADLATPSFGTGMPYASHTTLPSGAVRLVRFSAFTVLSTWRTASLALGSAILRAASAEFDIGFLLGLVSWHLVCQRSDCQDKLSPRNVEKTGNLTIWYLVCQKYSRVSSAKKTSPSN